MDRQQNVDAGSAVRFTFQPNSQHFFFYPGPFHNLYHFYTIVTMTPEGPERLPMSGRIRG